MLKMLIRMNDDKINIEKKYCLDRISQTIDNIFAKMGLLRMEDAADSLVYRDSGHDKDYSQFKKNCKYLKNSRGSWRMSWCGFCVKVMILIIQTISVKKIC